MRTELERIAFIRTQTRIERVPFVPELRIHSASEVSPLWAATQTFLDLEGLGPPYWAFAWAGGQALARFVLDEAKAVRGARVLDFASGSGLVGIAAVLAGAESVLAVDIDPVAVSAIRLNAELSDVAIDARCEDLVGTTLADLDVVLVGDVFYERDMATRVHAWLTSLAATGVQVLVGDPGRTYLPPGLASVATYEVPVSVDLESAEAKRTVIYAYPASFDGAVLDGAAAVR